MQWSVYIFIAKSRTNANCFVFDGFTVLKTLSKVWQMKLRFLGRVATYINREGKIKINLFTSFFFWCFLTLTLLHLFKWGIPFRREQYKNPVLNSATNLQIWHFPNRNKIFLCLNFWFVFLFRQALSQSSSTIRAIILRYFCNFASRLLCKPHLEEFSKNGIFVYCS